MPRINTYTDNTSIEDDDKLLTYDTQGAATKLTAFSRIWTWVQAKFHALSTSSTAWNSNDKMIVDRNGTIARVDASIPAKNIVETYNGSTLAGSAQSVKTAIDALNSKFSYETITDFNTFKTSSTSGTVRRYGESTGGAATHPPVEGGNYTFRGYVEGAASGSYCTQHFTIEYATKLTDRGRSFIRACINGTWEPWIEVARSGNGWQGAGDADYYISPGVYGFSAGTTYTNLPTGVTSGILEVICPNPTGAYCMQRLITTTAVYIRYRNASSGTAFGSWYKYTGAVVQ